MSETEGDSGALISAETVRELARLAELPLAEERVAGVAEQLERAAGRGQPRQPLHGCAPRGSARRALPPSRARGAGSPDECLRSDRAQLTEVRPGSRPARSRPSRWWTTMLERIEAVDPKLNSYIDVHAETARGGGRGAPSARSPPATTSGRCTACRSRSRTTSPRAASCRAPAASVLRDRVPEDDATIAARLRPPARSWSASSTCTSSPTASPPTTRTTARRATHGTPTARPAGRAAAPARPSPRGCATAPSAPTPAARSGCRRASTASPGCGPTIGRVSNHGIVPLAWTLDTAGPMCRTVADCAAMLEAIAGLRPARPPDGQRAGAGLRRELERGLEGRARRGARATSRSPGCSPSVEARDARRRSSSSRRGGATGPRGADRRPRAEHLGAADRSTSPSRPPTTRSGCASARRNTATTCARCSRSASSTSPRHYIQAQRYRVAAPRPVRRRAARRRRDRHADGAVHGAAGRRHRGEMESGEVLDIITAVMRYNALPPLTGHAGAVGPVRLRRRRPADRACSSSAARSTRRPCCRSATRYQQLTDWQRREPSVSGMPRDASRSRRLRRPATGTMVLIRRFEEAVHVAVPARRGVRLDAPLPRAGGGQRRRRQRCSTPRDRVAGHVPRPRPRARARHEPAAFLDELLGRATGICGGRVRLDERRRPRARARSAASASSAAASPPRPARRWRSRGSGGIAVAFFGDGAVNQAYFYECLNFARVMRLPGAVRVREQRLRRVHADGGRHARRHPRAPARARHPGRERRRPGRVGGARRGRARRSSRVRAGEGPRVPRGADVPLRRPRPRRSRQVPAGRGGRGAGSERDPLDDRPRPADRRVRRAGGGPRRGSFAQVDRGDRRGTVARPSQAPFPDRRRGRAPSSRRRAPRDRGRVEFRRAHLARRSTRSCARRAGDLLRRGRRRRRRRLPGHPGAARAPRRASASSTRRSPSWRSPAPRSAARSAGCGR